MIPPPGSWITIDAPRMRRNIRSLREVLAPSRMAMVVKADAYGHGVGDIVPIAEGVGIHEFAVFSAHEAAHVRQAATESRVQVMGHKGGHWDWVVENRMEPWISDIAEWPDALAAAERHVEDGGGPLDIHVELETGMHRTGLVPDNARRIIEAAADSDAVHVRGLCTHLAGAEDSRNDDRIQGQLSIFWDVERWIEETGLAMPLRHVSSSSAALLHRDLRMDMVRVGIACYGLWPTPEVKQRYLARRPDSRVDIHRVMTWHSRIMAVQDVPAGDYVGYGDSHQVTQDTRIAVVPVGYGDGLTRRMSNAGHLLVAGTRCPIVGPVNMNMVQIDISRVPDAAPGDEVVLIGRQGDEVITVHSFAETQEVVDYEFMARLSRDIPRIVEGE